MQISDSRRALFVHVQKTGGSTVDNVMQDAFDDLREGKARRHAPLTEILHHHPEARDYFIFGFVRNPWARLVSWHAMAMNWRQKAEEGKPWAIKKVENVPFAGDIAKNYVDFHTFIMEAPEKWERLRKPQLEYLRDGDREADFIGRTETLASDLQEVFGRMGIPAPESVPRFNTSPHTDYRDYYDEATRQRVAEVYAADIERFGYEF